MAENATAVLTAAQEVLTRIEDALANKLALDSTDPAFESLKSTIKSAIKVDDDVELPDEVLDAFAQTVAEKIDDSVDASTSFSFTKIFKSLVESIVESFTSASEQTVTVDGVEYELSCNPLNTKKISAVMNKIGTVTATVEWTDDDGEHETTLSWKDFTKKTLKEYVNQLKELAEDQIVSTWNNLVNGVETTVEIATAIRAIYSNSSNSEELLKNIFGNELVQSTVKSKIKSAVEDYIKNYVEDGTNVVKQLTKYAALGKKYNQLSTAVANDKNIESKARAFIKAANAIESLISISPVSDLIASLEGGLNYDFKNQIAALDDDYGVSFSADGFEFTADGINASLRADGISIVGDKKANTIIGGKGDDYIDGGKGKDILLGFDGDDTLNGGAGNDTLNGGSGTDVFYYKSGEGNDFIFDYTPEDGDWIKIDGGTVGSISIKNDDVVIKIGAKKLTVKDGVDKSIEIEDEAGRSIYVNGETVAQIAIESTTHVEPTADVYWFEQDSATNELDELIAVQAIENPAAGEYNVVDLNSTLGVNVIESKSIVCADTSRNSR